METIDLGFVTARNLRNPRRLRRLSAGLSAVARMCHDEVLRRTLSQSAETLWDSARHEGGSL